MGRRLALSGLIALILGAGIAQSSKAEGTLDIYFIDVEGGAATLIVTPNRQSVLIDTGWKRPDDRDAKRIYDVASREAGLKQIDNLITTHFHRDHFGGILALSKMIPIGTFYDHGPMTNLAEDRGLKALYEDYQAASGGKHQTLHPGDVIPLKSGSQSIVLKCLVANATPIGGSGAENPLCAQAIQMEPDPSENARSLGFKLTFGRFSFLDLGDLTWNVESRLVCPNDLIGPIDVYQVTHHGMKISNNPVLIQTVHPTVAIMDNGPAKGVDPETYARLKSVASIKDIWQLHRNLASTDRDNAPEPLTANLAAESNCTGNWIKVAVSSDSKQYQVTNSRNGNRRAYSTQ
jgi:competence protein ComEC